MLGIYCRTSKNRTEKHTIENQKEAGVTCAKALGIGYTYYIDDGISGTLDESVRDGFSDLLRDVKKKVITHIYCIDQSRIERDTRTWEFFVAECLNNDVKYYPGGSYFDLDNATNRMFAKLMSVVNSYYSEITSKKVRLANARKAKEGKTHGLKPYGFQRDENNNYVIDEEEAKTVRRIFQLSLEGTGAYTIANILNDEGIPTKFSKNFIGKMKRKDAYTNSIKYFDKSSVTWRGNVISDMLRNQIYKGIREWNRHEDKLEYVDGESIKTKVKAELIVSDVPQIIQPEAWDKVQKNLAINKKNVGRKDEYHYLLNGIIYCGMCGSEMRGKKRLKGNDIAYKCTGKRYPNSKCISRGINIPKLESFLIRYLFINTDLHNYLLSIEDNNDDNKLLQNKLDKTKDEYEKVTKGIEKAYALLLDADFSDDEKIKSRVLELNKKKENLTDTITLIEQKLLTQGKEYRAGVLKKSIKGYKMDLPFDGLKKLVHEMVEWISISHHKLEKGGTYEVRLKFRNFNEYAHFTTDWKSVSWRFIGFASKKKYKTAIEISTLNGLGNFDIKAELNQYKLSTEDGFSSRIIIDEEDIVYFD